MSLKKYLFVLVVFIPAFICINASIWKYVQHIPSGEDIAQIIRSGVLSENDIQLVSAAIAEMTKQSAIKTQGTEKYLTPRIEPKHYEITVRYSKGAAVYWPPTWNIKVVNATYGFGTEPESECLQRYRAWGNPGLIYCKQNYTACTGSIQVPFNVSQNTFKIAPPYFPSRGNCPQNTEVVELTVMVPKKPPNCNAISQCNGKGHSSVVLIVKGMYCSCQCNAGFTGVGCGKCEVGYYNWPDCLAMAFTMDLMNYKKTHKRSSCPESLLEHRCDNSKIPRPLWHPSAGPSFLSVLGCGISSLPWSCEFGDTHTTPVESISTLATGEFVGAHLLLLLESIALYEPEIYVYVGVDSLETKKRLSEAFSRFARFKKITVLVLKSRKLAFWYQEKPQVMKYALDRHRTTLWLDTDTFLVSRIPELPDSPLATFGCGVHDPRGWGSSVLPHRNGYTNTGVIFARNDTLHIDAWRDSMKRHDQYFQSIHYFKGQEQLYLDQGPMDVSITNTKGAFKLPPQWNVAWWTPDARLEDWRPHWWMSERNYGNRISIADSKRVLLLDDLPIHIIHSHFIKEEKHYGYLDSHFNSLIFDSMKSAAPGSHLFKMFQRLERYATHLVAPNRQSVNITKMTFEFLDTIIFDWDVK